MKPMNESDFNGRRSAESLLKYCGSSSLSEDGLREVFERRVFTSTNNTITRCYCESSLFHALRNERVTEGIIRCLLEHFPGASRGTIQNGNTPLHVACFNESMTSGIMQLLIDAATNSVRAVNSNRALPLHCLCSNERINEAAGEEIAVLLIEKYPQAVRHADNDGLLPIHIASMLRSPEFCQLLIKLYPESVRVSSTFGHLPLHAACAHNTVATVKYLYKLYPDAINHTTTEGVSPIHQAISGLRNRSNPECAVEIVKYLLECDPNVMLQKWNGKSLLCFACSLDYNDSNVMAGIQMIKAIYDAHPEAIEAIPFSVMSLYYPQVLIFIHSQLQYAYQAKDHYEMTTPDGNGRLPLHGALQDNATLGSIKLLVKGNLSAIRTLDVNGMIPLHIACEHHDSANVVKYLVGLDTTTLCALDQGGNTALHRACRSAKYETVALLLEQYDDISVSTRNADKKLPIDLLLESKEVLDIDRESIEYTECVFRLLRAYPETTMNF